MQQSQNKPELKRQNHQPWLSNLVNYWRTAIQRMQEVVVIIEQTEGKTLAAAQMMVIY